MHTSVDKTLVVCILLKFASAKSVIDEYISNRNQLLNAESHLSVGGHIHLTENERRVNSILMRYKDIEINTAYNDSSRYNFSKHYFTYRDQIEKSDVFKIIKKMPKGAALHIHSSLFMDADYFMKFTYEDNLFICRTPDVIKYHFSYTVPERPCDTEWTLLSELRRVADDVQQFDNEIKQSFTIHGGDPCNIRHADINSVWKEFNKVYSTVKSLITYRPLREVFMYDSLKKLYDDNVLYMEARTGLHELYELNGTIHDKLFIPKLWQDIVSRFQEDYPDFIGVKLIATAKRSASLDAVLEKINIIKEMKSMYPDIIAGFDLVGQEDLGQPLQYFLPVLLEAKRDLDFYFHGGETNWYGTETDENLVDAILLGTKRIGHGNALAKHPLLLSFVARDKIAVEVNVISNAILSLVIDVRNHPLANYLSRGVPVVLSSDDPGVWGADALSHDFYVAFVGVASKKADLKTLKQLALNSIEYSSLNNVEKEKFRNVFKKRWDTFLYDVISEYDGLV